MFTDVIEALDNSNDYREAGIPSDCNTIPYGTPSKCKPRLVVIIDGKFDIAEIISRALSHVVHSCRGKTKEVLFYIAIDVKQWVTVWKLFLPVFDYLKNQLGLTIKLHVKQTMFQVKAKSGTADKGKYPIRGITLCSHCGKRPGIHAGGGSVWSILGNELLCDECQGKILY